MKRLGILGGMGSQASAYFVSELVRQTPAKKDQDHIPFVLLNACNVPDRTTAIKAGNTAPVFNAIRPYLDDCIQLGVDSFVMPCNTVHCVYDDVVDYFKIKQADIHCYHMVDAVMQHAKNKDIQSVTLMATEGTMYSKLFHDHHHGVMINEPDSDQQNIITNLIHAKKSGGCDSSHQAQFDALVATFLMDSDAVILGCTELPLYVKNNDPRLMCPMQVQIQTIVSDFAPAC
ncbi:hypothetical protein DID73_01040 [Candidatus Marinamargulisbacteria bacterium SCGC AG-343-K17]|nr:hypothetical protein DID73_01040 [Candidatus Marinamargulisbacteria bacterium SCGC AG-343-K17]